jgi:hypothetical protein
MSAANASWSKSWIHWSHLASLTVGDWLDDGLHNMMIVGWWTTTKLHNSSDVGTFCFGSSLFGILPALWVGG